jgi:hypothetical protein
MPRPSGKDSIHGARLGRVWHGKNGAAGMAAVHGVFRFFRRRARHPSAERIRRPWHGPGGRIWHLNRALVLWYQGLAARVAQRIARSLQAYCTVVAGVLHGRCRRIARSLQAYCRGVPLFASNAFRATPQGAHHFCASRTANACRSAACCSQVAGWSTQSPFQRPDRRSCRTNPRPRPGWFSSTGT